MGIIILAMCDVLGQLIKTCDGRNGERLQALSVALRARILLPKLVRPLTLSYRDPGKKLTGGTKISAAAFLAAFD